MNTYSVQQVDIPLQAFSVHIQPNLWGCSYLGVLTAQFERARCSISPVEVISRSGVCGKHDSPWFNRSIYREPKLFVIEARRKSAGFF